ncbi:MAG: DUF3793 family protein [Oscillospiraceae bacterium]|nr:DUF3793 family protein [Oscillospiraceae bacterium]
MSEQSLIRNAAPTLAGLKTGSLFPFRYETRTQALWELRSLNRRLTPKGLRLLPLRMTNGFAVLYLYRPTQLQKDLQDPKTVCLLKEQGYADCSEKACLRELYRRFNLDSGFPHEVGLFLSYPPEDVRGFMEHRDQGCKCVGCWKVYGDERAARCTFAQFKHCTNCYLRQYAQGKSLEQLAVKI